MAIIDSNTSQQHFTAILRSISQQYVTARDDLIPNSLLDRSSGGAEQEQR